MYTSQMDKHVYPPMCLFYIGLFKEKPRKNSKNLINFSSWTKNKKKIPHLISTEVNVSNNSRPFLF